jgi:hypothetical protein
VESLCANAVLEMMSTVISATAHAVINLQAYVVLFNLMEIPPMNNRPDCVRSQTLLATSFVETRPVRGTEDSISQQLKAKA